MESLPDLQLSFNSFSPDRVRPTQDFLSSNQLKINNFGILNVTLKALHFAM